MKTLSEIVSDLRNFSSLLNPPCSDIQIEDLNKAFDYELQPEVVSLYKDHDGMMYSNIFPFRLLSSSEVLELWELTDWLIKEIEEILGDSGKLCILWTDDNTNYAGIFYVGKLKGKICFIDHNDMDLSPRFKNLFSFYESLLMSAEKNHVEIASNNDNFIGWSEMKTDFPVLDICSEDDENIKLANEFIKMYENETNDERKIHFAFCAMNLLPISENDKIIEFINSNDMWIQERACELIGNKQYEKGIPILANIAINRMHNGRIASMVALKKFKTKQSEEEIQKLIEIIEESGVVA